MKSTKICPQCGSIDITIPPRGMDLRLTVPDYCRKCQNLGLFPEIDMDQIEEFQRHTEKFKSDQHKND